MRDITGLPEREQLATIGKWLKTNYGPGVMFIWGVLENQFGNIVNDLRPKLVAGEYVVEGPDDNWIVGKDHKRPKVAYLTYRQWEIYTFFLEKFGAGGIFTEPGSYQANGKPIHGSDLKALKGQGCIKTRKVDKPGRRPIIKVTLLEPTIEVAKDRRELDRLRAHGTTPERAAKQEETTIHDKDPNEITIVPLGKISSPTVRIRKATNAQRLDELTYSITRSGVIEPVILKPLGQGRYRIIAGERRIIASRKAGLSTIPAILRDASDRQAVDIALIENIQRENLNPIEEAEAFQVAIEAFGYSHEELAARIGKPKTYVSELVMLLTLPHEAQELVRNRKVSKSKAIYLSRLPNPADQARLAFEIATNPKAMPDYEVRSRVKSLRKKPAVTITFRQELSRLHTRLRALNPDELSKAERKCLLKALTEAINLMETIRGRLREKSRQ